MRRMNMGVAGIALGLTLVLAGCSSSSKKPEPAALPAVSGSMTVSKAWTARLGEVTTPLQATVIFLSRLGHVNCARPLAFSWDIRWAVLGRKDSSCLEDEGQPEEEYEEVDAAVEEVGAALGEGQDRDGEHHAEECDVLGG